MPQHKLGLDFAHCNSISFAFQDIFTLLNMEHPDLFYHLPCGYNFQLDTRGSTQKLYMETFSTYHNCTDVPKIYHASGGSDFPID